MTTTLDSLAADIIRIARTDHNVLSMLLCDQTLTLLNGERRNISWLTHEYGQDSLAPIRESFFQERGIDAISPRALKHESLRTARSKARAEVFTPTWVCNMQNNLVDECWLGIPDAFNTTQAREDGVHEWQPTIAPVRFPEGKTWKDYVKSKRLEVACGEAPYLVSRYDATTACPIPISHRVGILDRKFRVIDENTPSEPTVANKRLWLRKALQAVQSVYGYDWQGDNVFLSRESILVSFCEYYARRWGRRPKLPTIMKVAEIVSWNVWQMDGTRFTIPETDCLCVIREWRRTSPLVADNILFRDLILKKTPNNK